MDCQAVKDGEITENYLHRRLEEAEIDDFETHLLECARCRRELELLQEAQNDLAARSGEIRVWTPAKPFFLRWQTVSVAALVVVVVAGAFFFRPKKAEQVLTAQHVPATDEHAATEEKPNLGPFTAEANPPSGSRVSVDGHDREDSSVVGHRSDNFSCEGKGAKTKDRAPTIGPAPTSGLDLSKVQRRRNEQEVPLRTNEAGDAKAQESIEAAQSKPSASAPSKVTPNKEIPALTTAQGVEAYRLGTVEAAPFSFAGLASRAADPKGGKSSTYSGRGGASNSGRKLFADGMNEYVDGHYREATGFLLGALRYEPVATDVNFYLGVSRILDGHPEESELPLRSVIAAGASLYLEPAHYYLGKAYVQLLKLKEAEREFQEAAKIPGPYATDAKTALARVTALREQIEQN